MTSEAVRLARLGCALNAQPTAAFLAGGTLTWEERWERLRAAGDVRRPDPERWLAVTADRGLRFVVPEDPEWPAALGDLGPAARDRATDDDRRNGRHLGVPFGLWLRGRPLDAARSVAIVGARAATDYGLSVAADLAMGVAEREVAVVSGAAYGIDAAAHRGALAGAGPTVAVLGCGVDVAYPAGHARLLQRVAESGTLVSELPPGTHPRRESFLFRNRLIAALAGGTVLVEAGLRSGARNTLGHARRLGRALMAVPGPITSALSAGCHAALREDPGTRLVTTAAEVVEEVGRIGADLAPVVAGPLDRRDGLGDAARRLLELLPAYEAWPAEQIGARLGLPLADAFAIASSLAAHELLEQGDDGFRLSALGRAPTRRE